MRTTIQFPEDLHRRLKAAAMLEGKPMSAIILRAGRRELQTEDAGLRTLASLFPMIAGEPNSRPGLALTNADQEDMEALATAGQEGSS